MMALMEDQGIKVISCELLSKRAEWQKKYAAFHVVVDLRDKDYEAHWPASADVRDWWFTTTRTSSYNLHGFQQGQQQLLELCNNHDVIAVQEHWLAYCDLNKIVNLNTHFSVIARSAMTDKLQQGLLRCRPFGGLALMFRRSLCTDIKYIGVEPSCRGLAAVITLHNNIKLLIINMYVPCFVAGSEYESTVLLFLIVSLL